MAKKSTASKQSPRKQSAPIELTEDEVRAAREGKGTHELPGESKGKDYGSVKAPGTKKPAS
jgi:hypothetical protein